jgi:hypothetical protein
MKNQASNLILTSFVVVLSATSPIFGQKNEAKAAYERGGASSKANDAKAAYDRGGRDDGTSTANDAKAAYDRSGRNDGASTANDAKAAFATRGDLAIGTDKQYSVRETYGNRDSIFLFLHGWGPDGHKYVALNSVGWSNLSSAQQVGNIKNDLNRAFPWFDAIGGNGQRVTLGNRFSLNYTVDGHTVISNPVRVIAVDDYSFTLEAERGHMLQGRVTFGIVKDKTGESWLYQIGTGVPNEAEDWQTLTYEIASQMWPDMASKVREINSSKPAPGPAPRRYRF